MPLVGLMFGSMFPCPPSLWPTSKGKEIWIDHYNRAHEEARKLVPEGRRLEYGLGEGWGPLCRFLNVEEPKGVKFPHVNESGEFATRISLMKKLAVRRIIRRWSPLLGVLVLGLGIWGNRKGWRAGTET